MIFSNGDWRVRARIACLGFFSILSFVYSGSSFSTDLFPKSRHLKILVLGNSITWHKPAPRIGWYGDWGMAASRRENDFSHILAELLGGETNPSKKVVLYPKNLSRLEMNKFVSDFDDLLFVREFNPAAIVVFLGDNVVEAGGGLEVFERTYFGLLKALRSHSGGNVYCVGTWWRRIGVDSVIRSVCESFGGQYIDISEVSDMPGSKANQSGEFSNAGVAEHPSDKGMRRLANRIFEYVEVKPK
ncbi:MAG: SGNH/GDSL hydrolase family protein [Denitromonas halophila]|nr:MAG: SGNH/GDSL hydrolase family protein [Denitromonas halophila]